VKLLGKNDVTFKSIDFEKRVSDDVTSWTTGKGLLFNYDTHF